MSAKSAQLVIHQDAEVVKQVRKAVNRALGDEAQVIFDSNFEDARKLIDNLSVPLSLVIIGDNTPANDEAAVGSLPSGAALAFIKDNCNKIPIIVLTSTTPDPKLTQLIDE
jgi:succinyl-CoA synthetase alpha subunit